MDRTELILTQPTSAIPADSPRGAASDKITAAWQADEVDGVSEERKRQIAKDFESLLISKLMDGVKDTIGHWGFDQDGPSRQIHGMFWLYLARDIANKGGFGLWKDLYKFLTRSA